MTYHNHTQEFLPCEGQYDMSPNWVSFELDAGWCAAAGFDPIELVRQYSGRFKLVYIKESMFLGLGASALCFVTWNSAVKILGAMKTSVYIYMVPVITVVTADIALNETIAGIAVFGIVLTLVGLFISEIKTFAKQKELKE